MNVPTKAELRAEIARLTDELEDLQSEFDHLNEAYSEQESIAADAVQNYEILKDALDDEIRVIRVDDSTNEVTFQFHSVDSFRIHEGDTLADILLPKE